MGPYKRYLYTGEKISRSTLYRRRQRAEQKALKEKLAYPKPTMETLPPYENTENVHHIEIKPQFEAEISDKPVGDIQMLMNLFTANIQSLQKNIEEKLDKVAAAITTQVSKLDKRISNLEDVIRTMPSSAYDGNNTSDSHVEEKVHIGEGILCSKRSYDAMQSTVESRADWCHAILKGVFGDEARLMRVRAVKKGTIAFSERFLVVAKSLHRQWLSEQTVEENGETRPKFSLIEIERYVSGLPAYMSDRAYDMNGPRGAAKKIKAARECGMKVSAERRPRTGPSSGRRPYVKRNHSDCQSQLQQQQLELQVQTQQQYQLLPEPCFSQ